LNIGVRGKTLLFTTKTKKLPVLGYKTFQGMSRQNRLEIVKLVCMKFEDFVSTIWKNMECFHVVLRGCSLNVLKYDITIKDEL